ncbi:YqhA family protein [Nitrosophilus alvini]|uniref:YqhA family protein n=1 Tax=Nitrosophilus alvini TaxID=2714855 RepID=UPI00190DD75E|nr:YqhA family protein [Nitrosophilus alvini]
MNILEKVFESVLWNSRLFIVFAVIFGMLGAVVLVIVASLDIFHVCIEAYKVLTGPEHPKNFHEVLIGGIIGAVDLYLIAVVLMLFSFGLYELFISKIDVARESESSKILQIRSLDQLKDKLAKVIVMVLVVSFFKRVLGTSYEGPLEMLYFAGSILALALGLYFLHKGGSNGSH